MPTPDNPTLVSPAALTVRLVVEAGANLTAAAEHLRKAMNPTAEGSFTDLEKFEAFVDGELLRAHLYARRAAAKLRQLIPDHILEDASLEGPIG